MFIFNNKLECIIINSVLNYEFMIYTCLINGSTISRFNIVFVYMWPGVDLSGDLYEIVLLSLSPSS